jgi:hypothetical protein
MITAILIAAHAFGTNPMFAPDLLYLGTLVADILIMQLIFDRD